MKKIKLDLIKNKIEAVEVFIAMVFMTSIWMGFVTPKVLIVNILLFIVYIELTRVVINFISEGNSTGMQIKYMVDGAIAFTLRELLIAMTDTHHAFIQRKEEAYLILIVLTTLFVLRWISTHFSPDK